MARVTPPAWQHGSSCPHRIASHRGAAGWDFGDAEQLQPLQCFGSVPTLVGAQSVSSWDLGGGYEAGGSFG